MTLILDAEHSCDAFLGGRLRVWQPKQGYRAGVDPVLLAAAVSARTGDTVLELGCGVGVASLCLAWRTQARVFGLERQAAYAELAARNAVENEVSFKVSEGDLSDMPRGLRAMSFDHVIANPPYFDRTRGTVARNVGREASLGEETALIDWVDAAIRRLKPKGYLTMIQRVDRLPDLLSAFDARVGDIRVLPLAPRAQRPAELFIIQARKSARGAFRLLPDLILHRGTQHHGDGESYTSDIRAALRDGAALQIDWLTRDLR